MKNVSLFYKRFTFCSEAFHYSSHTTTCHPVDAIPSLFNHTLMKQIFNFWWVPRGKGRQARATWRPRLPQTWGTPSWRGRGCEALSSGPTWQTCDEITIILRIMKTLKEHPEASRITGVCLQWLLDITWVVLGEFQKPHFSRILMISAERWRYSKASC